MWEICCRSFGPGQAWPPVDSTAVVEVGRCSRSRKREIVISTVVVEEHLPPGEGKGYSVSAAGPVTSDPTFYSPAFCMPGLASAGGTVRLAGTRPMG